MTMHTTVRLPLFRRRSTPFEETFGVGLTEVLTAIDRAGDDPVAGAPRVPIGLGSVGYRRSGILVGIDDPFGSGSPVHCIADVKIGTAVPASRRGLHMSRIGDALAQSVLDSYPDLVAFARTLAGAVSRAQYGLATSVEVRGRVPYVEDVPLDPRRKLSLEALTLLAAVRTSAGETSSAFDTGLRFAHLVACPCVQKVYRYAGAARLEAAPPDAPSTPGFTHSQRCITTVVARGLRVPLPVPRVLEEVDGVVLRTMNTLPRGSELALVYNAHRTPQFIEDALRDVLRATYTALDGARFSSLRGRARSLESIHEFDLRASATLTNAEARRCAGRGVSVHAADDLRS